MPAVICDTDTEAGHPTDEMNQNTDIKSTQKNDHEGLSKTSLFVSTLPYTSTNETLSDFFSQIGPLKTAFIIMKDSKHSGTAN